MGAPAPGIRPDSRKVESVVNLFFAYGCLQHRVLVAFCTQRSEDAQGCEALHSRITEWAAAERKIDKAVLVCKLYLTIVNTPPARVNSFRTAVSKYLNAGRRPFLFKDASAPSILTEPGCLEKQIWKTGLQNLRSHDQWRYTND